MKRWAVFFSVILLVAILSSCLPILAQPTHIPHQNPATAKGELDALLLLHFYSDIYDLAVARQHLDAQSLLSETEHAQIPDELSDFTSAYDRLSSELLTSLNNLEALLDEASTLFANDQAESARQRLGEAEAAVYSAQFLLEDIDVVTADLAEVLGVFVTLAGSESRQAYGRQQQNLYQLRQLIDELNQLRRDLSLNPFMAIWTSHYHSTLLEVSAPETACPGLPITISGKVSSASGNVERTVKVSLDNTELAEEIVQGQFSLQITAPQQISTGSHTLKVVITPQEDYAGASKSLPINISGIPIRTEIQTPLLAVIPGAIRIRGQVLDDFTPVEDAEVSLIFRDSTTIVKTASDGSFTATMEAPFELAIAAPQELRITIKPEEPWYALLEIKREIFMISPISLGLMLVAFTLLGLLVRNRVRISFPVPLGKTAIPETGLQEPPLVSASRPEHEFIGLRDRILSAYRKGLEAVEKAIGISMEPHTTLREFLNTTTPRIPTATKPFTELTMMAENALYSARKLDEDTAARAELLAASIKEELHSGAA